MPAKPKSADATALNESLLKRLQTAGLADPEILCTLNRDGVFQYLVSSSRYGAGLPSSDLDAIGEYLKANGHDYADTNADMPVSLFGGSARHISARASSGKAMLIMPALQKCGLETLGAISDAGRTKVIELLRLTFGDNAQGASTLVRRLLKQYGLPLD